MFADLQCTHDQPTTSVGRAGNRQEPPTRHGTRRSQDGDTRRHTEQPRPRRPRERRANAERASQRSILCVDDDPSFTRVLADGLTELGYAVDTASDGEVGLAKILADQPDLIVCDLTMPRMSGLELLKKVRQAGPEYSELPLILLTGHRDRDSELAGRRLGADDFLPKPVDFEMLRVVVENRLRHAKGRPPNAPAIHLTNRETDVLMWVGRGKTSAEIGIILGVSQRTVNFHCEQAMRRLDVVRRTQAVAKALAQGLIAA